MREREREPVEGRDGNNVTGGDAELKQATSKTQHFVGKLLAGLFPIAGDGDHVITPESWEAGQALTNVGLRLRVWEFTTHFLCFWVVLNSLRKVESAVLISKQYLIYWDKIRLHLGDDSPDTSQLNLIGYCDCKSLSLVISVTHNLCP